MKSRVHNENTITTFKEFWPFYLSQHSLPSTRRLHFIGTSFSIGFFLAVLVTGNLSLLLVALVCGYGPAWIAHFFVEHNRPATFRFPLFSLIADLKMWFLMLTRHNFM